jgi:hypothetical protein
MEKGDFSLPDNTVWTPAGVKVKFGAIAADMVWLAKRWNLFPQPAKGYMPSMQDGSSQIPRQIVGAVARLLQFLGRRALAVSGLAFTAGFVAPSACFKSYEPSFYGSSFYAQATILCCVTLLVCSLALINLVRAAERGYSPQRCQLSAVVLFFAFVGPVLHCLDVVKHYLL